MMRGKGLLAGTFLLIGLASCVSTTERIREHNREALQHVQRGNWAAALREFQEILRIDPDNVQARSNAGGIYYELGDREAAKREFAEAIRIDPEFSSPRYSLASIHFEEEAYEEARAHLRILAGQLREEGIFIRLAQATALAGHHEEAVGYLEEGLQVFPRSLLLARELAVEMERARPDVALFAWERVSRIAHGPPPDLPVLREAERKTIALLPRLSDEEMTSLLDAARAGIASGEIPEVMPPGACSDSPVAITLYPPVGAVLRGYGEGGTFRENLEAAIGEIKEGAKGILQVDIAYGLWIPLQLDWETSEVGGHRFLKEVHPSGPVAPGIHGLRLEWRDQSAVLFPGDIVRSGKEAFSTLCNDLRGRLAIQLDDIEETRAYKFFAISFADSGPEGRPVPLLRMNTPDRGVDTATIDAACLLGAEYLLAALQDDGRFLYLYNAVEDSAEEGYSLARHAGATLVLLRMGRRTGEDRFREGGQRALGHLLGLLRPVPGGGGGIALPSYRLGPTALALLAALEGDVPEEVLRDLGSYLLRVQRMDGSFDAGEALSIESPQSRWAPAQAILALTLLHERFGDGEYLEAARRGAVQIVERRESEGGFHLDHWFVQAAERLHPLDPDPRFVSYADRITDGLARLVVRPDDAPYPDWVGGFSGGGEEPRGAASLGSFEAIVAGYRLSASLGKDRPLWLDATRLNAAFALRLQYREENAFYLPAPEKAMGGFRQGIISPRIRIDGVQHAVLGLLGFRDLIESK